MLSQPNNISRLSETKLSDHHGCNVGYSSLTTYMVTLSKYVRTFLKR